jgi:Acyl-CoA carboxylase epsilon subunit
VSPAVPAEEASEQSESGGVDIRVLGGTPDAEELAAITAVLTGVLDELAAERGRQDASVRSAWDRSQRNIRGPLYPGAGTWRGFSG